MYSRVDEKKHWLMEILLEESSEKERNSVVVCLLIYAFICTLLQIVI